MKLFGREFKFNGFDVWHKGIFTPSTVATSGNYEDLINKPTSLPLNKNIDGTGGYSLSNTNGTYGGQYTKISTITITSRYGFANFKVLLIGGSDGGSPFRKAEIDFRVKQQNALGSDPYHSLHLTEVNAMSAADFIGVITSNTLTSTVVELYVRVPVTYEQLKVFVIGRNNTGSTITFHDTQGFIATLPEGTQISCIDYTISNSNAYSATKLQTARTINGVSFDGSGNITITADPNDHTHDFAPSGYGLGSTCRLATVDWNNQVLTGFYRGSGLANQPPAVSGSHSWWYVLVMTHDTSSSWILQLATDYNNKATYRRTRINGTWSSWTLMYTSDNKPTPADIGASESTHTHDNLYTKRNAGSVSDFNSALTQNEYNVGGSNISNAPYTGNIYGKLRVYVNDGETHNNSSNWIWQYFDDTSGRQYSRYKVNGANWTSWKRVDAGVFAANTHTHTKSNITDMPTKLSEFTNDIGAGGGIIITTAPTAPSSPSPGDFWYKEI